MRFQRICLRIGLVIAIAAHVATAFAEDWSSARDRAWTAYFQGHIGLSTDILREWLTANPARTNDRLWALYVLNEHELQAGRPRSRAAIGLDSESFPDATLEALRSEMSIHFRAARALEIQDGRAATEILKGSRLHQVRDIQALDIRMLQRLLLLDHASAAILEHRGPEVQISLDAVLISLLYEREPAAFERAQILSRVGIIYSLLGEDELGLSVFRAILPYWVKSFAATSPNTMTFLMHFAISQQRVGRFDAAADAWRVLLDISSNNSLLTPGARGFFYMWLAFAELSNNQPQSARIAADAAVEIGTVIGDDWLIAVGSGFVAEATLALGDADFLKDGPALLSRLETIKSRDPGVQAYAMRIAARIAMGLGELQRAARAIDAGLERLAFMDGEQSRSSYDIVRRSPLAHRRIIQSFVEIAAEDLKGPRYLGDVDGKVFFGLQLLNRDPVTLGISANAAMRLTEDPKLSEAIRKFERASRQRSALRSKILNALADLDHAPVPAPVADDLIASDWRTTEEIAQGMGTIFSTAPAYFQTSRGALAGLNDVKQALRGDEAFLMFGQAGDRLVGMCITAQGTRWELLAAPPDEVLAKNQKLRAVLEDTSDAALLKFDVDSARFLHDALFKPFSDCIGDRALIIAPPPNLLSIPFAVLLSEDPPPGSPFKDWRWLAKAHAISLVPSPPSFLFLRGSRAITRDRTAFLGVGNPYFSEGSAAPTETRGKRLFRGADNSAPGFVRKLPPLPDTEDELNAVRNVFGADQSRIIVGAAATERAVREINLQDYRFVEFATHGLVAGDFGQLLEPAIALTPENDADPENDGLLTTSEVRNLVMQADLVILSACNTAAADGTANATGLSGLANAFFEAGARGLLVTQWSLFSSAAVALMPKTLRNMVDDPNAGAPEALRRAMLGYLETASSPEAAHPRVWAPFVVVGDHLALRH